MVDVAMLKLSDGRLCHESLMLMLHLPFPFSCCWEAKRTRATEYKKDLHRCPSRRGFLLHLQHIDNPNFFLVFPYYNRFQPQGPCFEVSAFTLAVTLASLAFCSHNLSLLDIHHHARSHLSRGGRTGLRGLRHAH